MIEVFENDLKALLDPSQEPACISQGFQFTEGPVWERTNRCLYFSDIPANTLYRYSEQAGFTVRRKPSFHSNGMTIDQQGRLLVCEHGTHRVTREGSAGIEVVAESYRGDPLNSPNDVIVAGDGSIIFTDPHYGLEDGLGGPRRQVLPFRGVYRLAPGATELTLLVDDFTAPNGLALSQDERTLYIDDTIGMHLRAFAIGDGWKLKNGRVLFDFPRGADPGVPDGMKLDEKGNIWCTGPYGVWVVSPSGAALGCIHMPEVTANLNWGEEDGRTLFMTASTGVYRLRTLARGRYIGG